MNDENLTIFDSYLVQVPLVYPTDARWHAVIFLSCLDTYQPILSYHQNFFFGIFNTYDNIDSLSPFPYLSLTPQLSSSSTSSSSPCIVLYTNTPLSLNLLSLYPFIVVKNSLAFLDLRLIIYNLCVEFLSYIHASGPGIVLSTTRILILISLLRMIRRRWGYKG